MLEKRECTVCGVEFEPRRKDQITCSRKCSKMNYRFKPGYKEKEMEKKVNRTKKRLEKRVCPVCNTEFYPRRKDQFSCSALCSNRNYHLNINKNADSVYVKKCRVCGEEKTLDKFEFYSSVCTRCRIIIGKKKISRINYELYSDVEKFLYDLKAKHWYADESDIFKLINIHDLVSTKINLDIENREEAIDYMFLEIVNYYKDRKKLLDAIDI